MQRKVLKNNHFRMLPAVVMTKLAICLSLLLTVSCSRQQTSASEEGSPEARITFLTGERHNFGNFYTPDTLTCAFVFRNTGTVPFVISRVEPSCQCTEVEFSTRPVAPGAIDSFIVHYDGNGSDPGFFTKRCEIYSNADTVYSVYIRGFFIEKKK